MKSAAICVYVVVVTSNGLNAALWLCVIICHAMLVQIGVIMYNEFE